MELLLFLISTTLVLGFIELLCQEIESKRVSDIKSRDEDYG